MTVLPLETVLVWITCKQPSCQGSPFGFSPIMLLHCSLGIKSLSPKADSIENFAVSPFRRSCPTRLVDVGTVISIAPRSQNKLSSKRSTPRWSDASQLTEGLLLL